jgi:bifunctional UDP-N-acetylglucosamine pyrophosphorylase/glucosamine-1-phosphate N-acetyltransferase
MESFIDKTVKIGKNVKIEAFCVIKGNSVLEDGAIIESFSYIENSHIGRNTVVKSSRIMDSVVGEDCSVGPWAHIRQKASIGNSCRIGNYVEVKDSVIGDNTKAAHLTYIGDATIGKGCNIGCGVIFCNFDGINKHKSVVEDNVFIGSNCNIIAPITLAQGTYIASGTTVTDSTNKHDMVIGRTRAEVKPGRAIKYLITEEKN